jgi:hypothetical protein
MRRDMTHRSQTGAGQGTVDCRQTWRSLEPARLALAVPAGASAQRSTYGSAALRRTLIASMYDKAQAPGIRPVPRGAFDATGSCPGSRPCPSPSRVAGGPTALRIPPGRSPPCDGPGIGARSRECVLFLGEPRAALNTEVLDEVGSDTIRVEWDRPVAVVTGPPGTHGRVEVAHAQRARARPPPRSGSTAWPGSRRRSVPRRAAPPRPPHSVAWLTATVGSTTSCATSAATRC